MNSGRNVSPIFANVALQPRLNVVHKSMMWFVRIYVIRYIATQIADNPLVLVVVEFDVQRQIVQFYHFVAMRAIDARMILLCVLLELFLCRITFDAFGFNAFEWQQQMSFFGMTVEFVFGQKCQATRFATATKKWVTNFANRSHATVNGSHSLEYFRCIFAATFVIRFVWRFLGSHFCNRFTHIKHDFLFSLGFLFDGFFLRMHQ